MGAVMKRLIIAGGLALAGMIAGPALAADMPVKAKAPPPIAYYDWSGVYIGLSLGGVWAEVDRFYPLLDLVGLVPQTFTSRNEDAIAGFHAGAQWQLGQWVIGVEVAYSKGWRDISGTVSLSPPEPFTTLGAYNKISRLLTVGPRLGSGCALALSISCKLSWNFFSRSFGPRILVRPKHELECLGAVLCLTRPLTSFWHCQRQSSWRPV